MATDAVGETPTLFLRKATGLVRGWNVRDSIIYACLATNFVTLGIYEFTFAAPPFPTGQLITAVIISAYLGLVPGHRVRGLIVTIPRAGGDYVWQTRILGSGIGFVMAVDRVVVHPLAVGAHLRQHPRRTALRAAVGHAGLDLARRRGTPGLAHRTACSSSP